MNNLLFFAIIGFVCFLFPFLWLVGAMCRLVVYIGSHPPGAVQNSMALYGALMGLFALTIGFAIDRWWPEEDND